MKHLLTNFSIFLLVNIIINIISLFLVGTKRISKDSTTIHMIGVIQSLAMLFITVSIVMIAKKSGWKA